MKTPGRKWLEEMADGEDECRSVSVAGDPSRTPWRWFDANHGIGSNNGPVWPYFAVWIMLFLFTATNSYWAWRVNRLNEQVQAQSIYIDATRDLASLLSANGVYFKWQDGKPVQVFDE